MVQSGSYQTQEAAPAATASGPGNGPEARAPQTSGEHARQWGASVGERAGHVADAVRSAGESLRGQEDWLADAADTLGRSLTDLSRSAAGKGLHGIKAELERVARERPTLFMGAAIAAGVALGRILRSSAADANAPGESPRPGKSASGSQESARHSGTVTKASYAASSAGHDGAE